MTRSTHPHAARVPARREKEFLTSSLAVEPDARPRPWADKNGPPLGWSNRHSEGSARGCTARNHLPAPLLAMKRHGAVSFAVLALWLLTGPARSASGPEAAVKTSIPRIASLGKIQIGRSTQEDLARLWGEGEVTTGGHANSGRLWRVKGTSWVVHTDGFEYSKRGLVVDSLELFVDAQRANSLPEARLPRSDFAWLGKILPGMPRAGVRQILQAQALTTAPTKDGVMASAEGFHALENHVRLKTWSTHLDFTNGALSRLRLYASE